MPSSSTTPTRPFSLFLFSLVLTLLPSTVKPLDLESDVLRLPSDAADGELNAQDPNLCPNSTAAAHGSCPVKCFRPDPVCGEDGMTYWCGCADAHCSGKRVVKVGFCEVGSGGSGSIPGQALLLVHIVWMIVLGFSILCGFL